MKRRGSGGRIRRGPFVKNGKSNKKGRRTIWEKALTTKRNAAEDILPGVKLYTDVLRVYDTKGMQLYSDIVSQRVLCTLEKGGCAEDMPGRTGGKENGS